MAVGEWTLSEFLQYSGRLLAELDDGEIILRRRNGEDLVLMTASQREALRTLSRTFLGVAGSDEQGTADVMPWLRLLSPTDRQVCLEELRNIAGVVLEMGRLGRLVESLAAWEATALATWDDERNRERQGFREDAPGPLERPEP